MTTDGVRAVKLICVLGTALPLESTAVIVGFTRWPASTIRIRSLIASDFAAPAIVVIAERHRRRSGDRRAGRIHADFRVRDEARRRATLRVGDGCRRRHRASARGDSERNRRAGLGIAAAIHQRARESNRRRASRRRPMSVGAPRHRRVNVGGAVVSPPPAGGEARGRPTTNETANEARRSQQGSGRGRRKDAAEDRRRTSVSSEKRGYRQAQVQIRRLARDDVYFSRSLASLEMTAIAACT